MKIFYIHNGNFEDASPSSTFIMNRVKGLLENHNRVILIVNRCSDESTENILSRKFDLQKIPENLKVYRISAKSSFIFFLKMIKIFKSDFSSGDIIYTRALGLIPWLYFINKYHRGKLFFENHDFFYDLNKRNDIKVNRRKKHSLIEKIFFNRINGLVCVNQSQIELYKKYLNIPMIANHCGIPFVKSSNKRVGKVLAYVGSIDERKGINSIIDLMGKLDNSYKLIIFGGKNEKEINLFMDQISRKGLENRIEITGWINKEQLNKRLQEVNLGLIPLEDLFFNRYLTYPLKVSDYFSHGIPILTNEYETAKAYLFNGSTGFYVNWSDLDKTKTIIEKITKNESIYNNLVKSVLAFNNKNSTSNNAKKLVDFFSSN